MELVDSIRYDIDYFLDYSAINKQKRANLQQPMRDCLAQLL